jgi:hypothetical protein
MICTDVGVTSRPTAHFEKQASARRLNRGVILGCVAALAPRAIRYQGCRLALDCGCIGIPVVKIAVPYRSPDGAGPRSEHRAPRHLALAR